MANSKISALTSATTPLAGTEVLPIVQSSTTVKASIANIQAAPVAAGTANTVQYLNGSKVPTTSTALSFDGNILGVGGTPSPWAILTNTIDLSNGASLFGYNNNAYLNANMYFNGGYKYKATAASARYEISNGQHFWFTALSGTAGDPITFVQRMQLENGDGTLTLNTGNLVQGTAAKGINFTANTPAAGMTSQLLNWYEEGTWTPAMVAGTSGTITTGSVGGKYTRVGRQVTATGYIDAASVSAPIGALTITGLPFACGSGLGSRTAAAIYPSGLSATAVTSVIGRVISGESQIRVDKYSAGTISNMAGDVIASTSFHFSVTYFV